MSRLSIANSFDGSINNGSSFTGNLDDTLLFSEIQIIVNSSLNTTINVNWFSNPSFQMSTEALLYNASYNTVIFNVKPKARFFYINIDNNSGITRTLHLQTIMKSETNINCRGNKNLWNNSTVAINGVSNSVLLTTLNVKQLTFYGSVNSATTLTVQYSNDNTNYFSSQNSYKITGINGADFGFTINCNANFIRLISSNASTITAYVDYV